VARGFRQYAETLLKNSLGATKVVLKFGIPPAEITFDKAEFGAMLRTPEIASRTIAHCFVERRVFWEDLTRENFSYVIDSLIQVEPMLDAFDRDLTGSTDLAAIGNARFVRSWRARVVETRKQLSDQIAEIDKEKAEDPCYDSAGQDRHMAMVQSLIDLRVRVYPLVISLIDLIDEADPIKRNARDKLRSGLKLLSPEQVIELDLDIEVLP
jgi:hypothetical protein